MTTKLNLKKTLIMFALIPLTVGLIALALLSGVILTNSVKDAIKNELSTASNSLREWYGYDIANNIDLVDGFCEYDTSFIDTMQAATSVEYTLFNKDERFMTTIRNESGNRIEGTKASPEVWATVSQGSDYYSDDVKINGIDFYVYYLPMYNADKTEVIAMAFSGKPCAEVEAAERKLYMMLALFAIVLEAVFLIVAWLISKKISNPITEIATNIEELSNGETNITVKAESHISETVTLIGAARKLSEILHDSIEKIKGSADALKESVKTTSELAKSSSAGTSQIEDAMNGLSKSTETMAESVQEMNENIISMGSMIDGIVESTDKLNDSSAKMSEAGNEATKCIKDMTESSKKSSDAIEDITEKISTTNDSVKKITEMVDMITDIASQTNLLSLNASIEAARAGDAGKGFGVVATEIGTLAEQSGASAEKITAIVSAISAQSAACVKKSNEVRDLITQEQSLLNVTREKFEILEKEILSSVSEIHSVSDATEQLNNAKEIITSAISDLSAISQETAATNEEVTAQVTTIAENVNQVSADSEKMHELSNDLGNAVSYFK